jgi:elongator complex protein 4
MFCHSFDLTRKLAPGDVHGSVGFYPSTTVSSISGEQPRKVSPFKSFLKDVDAKVAKSPAEWIHRIMVPNMLSPTLYSGEQCRPEEVLQFLHGLRALLRRHATKLVAMITLPVSLHPRSSGLTRWMELLSDGVLELVPLSLSAVHTHPPSEKLDSRSEEQTQGLLRIHSLPIFHEKGGGGTDGHAREDMSFSLSRTKGLIIRPFSLPPLVNDEPEKEAQKPRKGDIEF